MKHGEQRSIRRICHEPDGVPLLVLAMGLCVLVAGVTAVCWRRVGPPSVERGTKSFQDPAAIRRTVFDEQVLPTIREADEANRAAAERCLQRIAESFAVYRLGIVPFAQDVTSLGSRFGVIRRMPIDWWYESETVGDFIGRKLEKHVFSAERIERDLGAAVTMFRQDVETNQARMLAQIQAAVSSASIPELNELDAATFTRDVHEMLLSIAAETGRRDAALFVATEATSGVAGVVAEQIFVAILIRMAGLSGGSLGAGAAVGGGGGLLTGPVGATLGVAVGVIVALAVERWCTESVKGELRETVRRLIDQVEQAVLNGVTGEELPNLQPRPGLKDLLNDSCDQLQRAYGEVFRQRLLGDAT